MSTRKQPTNFVQRLLKRVWRSFNVLFKTLLNGVLWGLRVSKRRSRQSQAGFVLPTVVMVLLVVALLTTAIVIRSFDRAKNASNFRVDQAVLNAATPAIDRAKAKIERLLSPDENRLAGSPPGEGKLSTDTGTISYVLNQPQYTFGDETRLKLVHTIQNPIQGEPAKQTLETVWKFPVDTDNNGKYDTFTLYGIYFQNPPVETNGNPKRARTPVEARAVPQATGSGSNCGASSGGAASGTSGWYQTDGQLKKAFFVYVANVPIAKADIDQIPAAGQTKYEPYKGNKGFSALEMQEDQARISLDNNAVWYDDDLVISNVPTFRVNGRIHTNSNLMVANPANNQIVFRQVSALQSCYYTAENGLITVGGNVVAGDVSMSSHSTNNEVQVDRYQRSFRGSPVGIDPSTNPVFINDSNKTTTVPPNQVASNSGAYDRRLNLLVKEALALHPTGNVTDVTIKDVTRYPQQVRDDFNSKYDTNDPSSGRSILTQVLTSYFAKRIRRVSYKEVPPGQNPYVPLPNPPAPGAALPDTSSIDPVLAWMSQEPTAPGPPPELAEPDPFITPTTRLPATNPSALLPEPNLVQNAIGDRVLVGDRLPTEWLTKNTSPDTYATKGDQQNIPGVNWPPGQRWRESRVQQLDDLGDTSRGGFWEQAAAYSGNAAKNYKELAGGLRVVTGAGIYIDDNDMTNGVGAGKRGVNSFLPVPPTVAELQNIARTGNPTYDANGVRLPAEVQNATGNNLLKYKVVWPDTMPMFRWDDTDGNGQYTWGAGEVKRGDLQMRATVVYHYAEDVGNPPQPITPEDSEPIACIATYYDPTNKLTAQNVKGLPPIGDQETTDYGSSLNGVNYPYALLPGLRRAQTNLTVLQRQADMIFPDGRWVNKPLKDALKKIEDSQDLSLNDIAAIDAANCALTILYGATPTQPAANAEGVVPDGAIQERTFLDARQIKAIHKRNTDKAGNTLKRVDGTTNVDRETLLEDITNPVKLKIAELGSLAPIDSVTKKESSLPPEYSLPIEQRQPLEIRVTQIDLKELKKNKVGTGTGSGITSTQEYMLPNTGIIYASRDDALPDASDPDGGSGTDFKLDPTRRPNGIRLINGENLARENDYRLVEKGLILASDLPVYIKGSFNLHVTPGTTDFREEFLVRPTFYNGINDTTNLDPDFACRPGSCPVGSDKGDQWRPARILADAVTLLSKNFRDGYRNEGDFDLNNNIGNLAVEARLKNGFWWNSFATSAEWYDPTTGFPKDFDTTKNQIQGSSYATNAVTPIQRRVNFPEYKMEICEKFPVSACGSTDWKTEGAGTTAAYEGTITDTPLNPRFVDLGKRVFPRRLAFERNAFGQLIPGERACTPATLTDPGNCYATPIAPNGTGVFYGTTAAPAGSGPPTAADNALWYLTTTDNAKPNTGISYDKAKNLYYLPFDAETVSERQFLLPGMPESLTEILKLLQIWPAATPSPNGITEEDTPDYAIYSVNGTTCQLSKAYKATDAGNVTSGACSINALTGIKNLWEGLRNNSVPIDSNLYLPVVKVKAFPPATSGVAPALDTVLLQAEAKLNIYNLPTAEDTPNAAILSNLEITLDRNGQDDPIFVFRTDQNIDFRRTVEVKLKGVDPNNIFWVSGLGTRIALKDELNFNSAHPRHKLVGNFIGGNDGVFLVTENINSYVLRTTAITVGEEPIQGGRILGFNKTYASFPIPPNVMTALTTTDQPLVMPILQLHSPQGVPDTDLETALGTESITVNHWIQRVTDVPDNKQIYDAVFIMGDTPSRPLTASTGESGGGLPNFPRFLESWESAIIGRNTDEKNATPVMSTQIRGSFIQFKKSAFATAPFEAIDDPTKDNSLFFDGANAPDYTSIVNAPFNRYVYKGGGQGRKAPYYRPPIRDWGYDVGLLSQTPDLFSRRFANPTAGTPNQYFRQVNRNDPWIETLLCAAQPAASGTGYEWAIADPQQRPTTKCPSSLADFN